MAEPTTEIAEREQGLAELAPDTAAEVAAAGGLKPHPSPLQYVIIAVVLVIVTAIEVAVSYLEGDVSANILIAILMALAALKFFLVVAWYMHLRTDIKFFSGIFTVGLVAAATLYLIVLLSLTVFDL